MIRGRCFSCSSAVRPQDLSFWSRMFWIGIWVKVVFMRYMAAWLIAEGGCIMIGESAPPEATSEVIPEVTHRAEHGPSEVMEWGGGGVISGGGGADSVRSAVLGSPRYHLSRRRGAGVGLTDSLRGCIVLARMHELAVLLLPCDGGIQTCKGIRRRLSSTIRVLFIHEFDNSRYCCVTFVVAVS